MLNSQSGLLGVSGISNDIRDVLKSKSKRAKLAIEVFCYNAAKWIGAYIAALNGIDAIVFTGGIGENNPEVRKKILKHFSYLKGRNKFKVFVIPSDEEEEMLEEAEKV